MPNPGYSNNKTTKKSIVRKSFGRVQHRFNQFTFSVLQKTCKSPCYAIFVTLFTFFKWTRCWISYKTQKNSISNWNRVFNKMSTHEISHRLISWWDKKRSLEKHTKPNNSPSYLIEKKIRRKLLIVFSVKIFFIPKNKSSLEIK